MILHRRFISPSRVHFALSSLHLSSPLHPPLSSRTARVDDVNPSTSLSDLQWKIQHPLLAEFQNEERRALRKRNDILTSKLSFAQHILNECIYDTDTQLIDDDDAVWKELLLLDANDYIIYQEEQI